MADSTTRDSIILSEVMKREVRSEHIVTQLAARKTNLLDPAQWYHQQRAIYTTIVPNYSENRIRVQDARQDGCFLRKFCPDGHHLLAFSQDQHSVEIFRYKGACAARHLYSSNPHSDGRGHSSKADLLFKTFFEHELSILVSKENEMLNRECSLFLGDDHSVIVASSAPVPDDPYPHMFETFKNNESLSPNVRFSLENYTLYLVNLNKWSGGCVTDSRSFKCDKIFLSHNQGLSLCGSKLAVLSAQHQSIHLFEVVSGTFIPLQEIGRFCYPDDSLNFDVSLYNPADLACSESSDCHQPFLEKWINSLKHRFLCYIKEQAESLCTSHDRTPLMKFYQRFDYFKSLRIWKMQLLDSHTLLLKYATEDIVTLRVSDPISQPAFFAFYDIETTRIFGVYENSSEDFLFLYEEYAELFRTAVSHPLAQDTSCVSNCRHCRALHMKFKQTITNARHGGVREATKRLLVQIPVCSQSFSCSPYLDLDLYRYDDKWISPLERPKQCGDAPIRFFSRREGKLRFSLYTTPLGPPLTTAKKLAAYIFHPYEPFVISIQKTDAEYIVNFHFRNV